MGYNLAMSLIESKIREELSLDRLDGHSADYLESTILEFKEWDSDSRKDQLRQLREAVVAFANAEGGYIVLGVRDKKKNRAEAIQDLGHLDEHGLQKSIYDGTEPHIQVEVAALDEPEGRLLAVRVPKSFLVHTTADGVGKIRVGKENKPLTGSGLTELARKRADFDLTAEVLPGMNIASLDPEQFSHLREIIRKDKAREALANLPNQDLLGALELTPGNGVTRAALLLLGHRRDLVRFMPGHEVTLLNMQSDTRYSHRQDLREPLLEILTRAQKFIEENPRLYPVRLDGYVEAELPDVTWNISREAILNAVTHRDYFRLQTVYVRRYESRLEISNPGGFIGGITPQNILRHEPIHRNPLLAEVFQKIGLVNRAGLGVDRIYTELLQLGKGLPSYQAGESNVKLVIPTDTNADFVRFVKEERQQGKPLELDDLIVLRGLTQHGLLNALSAGKLLHLSEQNASPKLVDLRRRGYLIPVGRGRRTSYRLAPDPAERLATQQLNEDQNLINREALATKILQIIHERGRVTNAEVRAISGYDRVQAKTILATLYEQGHITLVGRGRAAHYVPADSGKNLRN